MITVYTPAYNEEVLIQFMINHYRQRFPGCRIVVYDNLSTDNTVKIALANGCQVIPYDTNDQLQDRRLTDIKNNCWKNATTDWVLVCDVDELLDINEAELKQEEVAGVNMIRTDCYDMINLADNFDIAGMKYGVKSPLTGKSLLFNKKSISQINYEPGAHECHPVGTVIYSQKMYKLYHYTSINERRTYEKCLVNGVRLSPENIKNGWGVGILVTPTQNTPELIHKDYIADRKQAIRVR